MQLKKWIEKLKEKWKDSGYTCDFCGREVFDYPHSRFCRNCESALHKNDGNVCDKCGRAVVTAGVCLTCKKEMPAFDKGLSPLIYHGDTAGLVNQLKRGKKYLALPFSERMTECVKRSGFGTENAVVVYVPLDREKKRMRGYDQAEELAKNVAKQLNLPLLDVMVCIPKKMPQKELSIAERKKNVEGRYRLTAKKPVKGKRVILVDDIMTTGATGNECAIRLKKAGAESVYFLTAASLPERK